MLKIALICGGPSPERGISLNSARSVMDHLSSNKIEIVPFYLNRTRQAFRISPSQLYSNTPSDFDFKLAQTAKPLSETAFVKTLRQTDLVFPVIHGAYGEDGGIQRFFEKHNIPYVGSTAAACTRVFDKFKVHEALQNLGLFTMPTLLLKIFYPDHKKLLDAFFKQNQLTRVIVKPASGGSSIGVFSVGTPAEALEKTKLIFSKRLDTRVVVEPFATGREFTVIILQNRFGVPVALLPTEIETDYTNHQIFDYRKKYLPTRQVTYHCPPRFSDTTMQTIRSEAEHIFSAMEMRDFARFDGWVMPDGKIWFSDLNPISGMEQNSFLFQQSTRIGLSHKNVLRHIVERAAERYGLRVPAEPPVKNLSAQAGKKQKPVSVIFGGATSERQVSVMSGTNVWLKLKNSTHYNPTPYLLVNKNEVWKIPYPLALYHTAEEIAENCHIAKKNEARLAVLTREIRLRLGLPEKITDPDFGAPLKMILAECIKESPFVFLGLHGGSGENGDMQKTLTQAHKPFNGPSEKASRLCMDKWNTKQAVAKAKIAGVHTIPGTLLKLSTVIPNEREESLSAQAGLAHQTTDRGPSSLRSLGMTTKQFWKKTCRSFVARSLVVKPRADGCSSGVVKLDSWQELQTYLQLLKKRAPHIPAGTFKNQAGPIDLPPQKISEVLIEKTIETDVFRTVGNNLKYIRKSGWIEITVGVIELNKQLHAFNPSLTIAERAVLSVEEKFQGGTGINITPPPAPFISKKTVKKTKKIIEHIATHLDITGYARLDAFMNVKTGDVMLIEVNTLPALTPSTVLYQQALAEPKPVYPKELLEQFIKNKGY